MIFGELLTTSNYILSSWVCNWQFQNLQLMNADGAVLATLAPDEMRLKDFPIFEYCRIHVRTFVHHLCFFLRVVFTSTVHATDHR
jgi:hypothetical protein